jgi:hypothetical protein
MKYIIIGMLIFFIRCTDHKNDNLLVGAYAGSFEHEYGKNYDTLFLNKANDGNSIYQINRHTGFIKKEGGKMLPKQLLIESWLLELDESKHILTELKHGKIIIWNGNTILRLGDVKYQRILEGDLDK